MKVPKEYNLNIPPVPATYTNLTKEMKLQKGMDKKSIQGLKDPR